MDGAKSMQDIARYKFGAPEAKGGNMGRHAHILDEPTPRKLHAETLRNVTSVDFYVTLGSCRTLLITNSACRTSGGCESGRHAHILDGPTLGKLHAETLRNVTSVDFYGTLRN